MFKSDQWLKEHVAYLKAHAEIIREQLQQTQQRQFEQELMIIELKINYIENQLKKL